MTTSDYPPPISQLLTFGDCRKLGPWPDKLDYLIFGFTAADIPELLRMAVDEDLRWADSESLAVWAPVHAWRALGQLRAEAAIEPLLSLLHDVDDEDDEWVGEDIPDALGLIGPTAIPAVRAYLLNEAHGLWARITATGALEKIGLRHPEAGSTCADALIAALERYADNDETLNAFIISSLQGLKDMRAVHVMERAFAADAVDLSVGGDWEDVQIDLGLRAERTTPLPEEGWWRRQMAREGKTEIAWPPPGLPARRTTRPASTKNRAKVKAKRKQANKARKQNRKK